MYVTLLSNETFTASFINDWRGFMWALWPTGRVQQPQRWVLPSLSCQKQTAVLLSLSSPAQTLNACSQMRGCLHFQAAGTRGNCVTGLKTQIPFESIVIDIFIDLSLIAFVGLSTRVHNSRLFTWNSSRLVYSHLHICFCGSIVCEDIISRVWSVFVYIWVHYSLHICRNNPPSPFYPKLVSVVHHDDLSFSAFHRPIVLFCISIHCPYSYKITSLVPFLSPLTLLPNGPWYSKVSLWSSICQHHFGSVSHTVGTTQAPVSGFSIESYRATFWPRQRRRKSIQQSVQSLMSVSVCSLCPTEVHC